MDTELKQYLEQMEGRLNARIEKSETSLLTAFHDWARPMEIRVRNASSVASNAAGFAMGFEERLALAEERISALERKKAS